MSRKLRSAFSMVELAFVTIIIGITYVGVIKTINSAKQSKSIQDEKNTYIKIEAAIKENFISILDAYEPICSAVPSDATASWGWRLPACTNTSPYPRYSTTGGKRLITYTLKLGSLSAANRAALQNSIVGSFNGVCNLDATTNANRVVLDCPKITNVQYYLGAGFLASAHTFGNPLNPVTPPMIRIGYDRRSEIGNVVNATYNNQTYDFTMNDVYTLRQNYSISKMNFTRNKLKEFHKSELLKELNNNPSGGLNSMDDEFVPWFWKAFGNNAASIYNICTVVGGTCTNLNSANIWRSSGTAQGLLWRRLVQNLFSAQTKYTVDGFNNQIKIYPIAAQCAGTNLDTCVISAPPIPADYYINGTTRPPFTSILYVDGYNTTTAQVAEYARMYVGY